MNWILGDKISCASYVIFLINGAVNMPIILVFYGRWHLLLNISNVSCLCFLKLFYMLPITAWFWANITTLCSPSVGNVDIT